MWPRLQYTAEKCSWVVQNIDAIKDEEFYGDAVKLGKRKRKITFKINNFSTPFLIFFLQKNRTKTVTLKKISAIMSHRRKHISISKMTIIRLTNNWRQPPSKRLHRVIQSCIATLQCHFNSQTLLVILSGLTWTHVNQRLI